MAISAAELGLRGAERDRPFARFFQAEMAPLPEHVREALAVGAVAAELLPSFEHAGELLDAGDWPIETGFAIPGDGSARVFVLTDMPGVTPDMWDWWFAWHGNDAARYKLWHPRAHISAAWADGGGETSEYVGRVSHVVEHIGAMRLKGAIAFVPPSEAGLDENKLRDRARATAICARVGITNSPLQTGWLIHHVRATPMGSQMRSRFWLGGENAKVKGVGAFGAPLGRALGAIVRLNAGLAADLLVHCAQEMNHLARFLPELHAEFGPKR